MLLYILLLLLSKFFEAYEIQLITNINNDNMCLRGVVSNNLCKLFNGPVPSKMFLFLCLSLFKSKTLIRSFQP